MDIGKVLRELMGIEGKSLRRMSFDLRVDRSALHRSLKDGANPEWKTIDKILEYLGYQIQIIKHEREDEPMRSWFYQMGEGKKITVEIYRDELWEGDKPKWPTGAIRSVNKVKPKKGDKVILFFAPKKNDEPGVYGWGTILRHDYDSEEIRFTLNPPSDQMKENPIWDTEVEEWAKGVRLKAGRYFQATMWEIAPDLLRPNNMPKGFPSELKRITKIRK